MNRDSSTAELLPPFHGKVDLLIIAGEHSGDELAAHMVQNLMEKNPHLKVAALGGNKLRESGAELVFNMVDHSVMGLVDVIKNYSFLKGLFDNTLNWIKKYQPKNICFVDYPGFNLQIAKYAKKRGIPVFWFIAPQVWAWNARRVRKMKKYIDKLFVALPFELNFFQSKI